MFKVGYLPPFNGDYGIVMYFRSGYGTGPASAVWCRWMVPGPHSWA
jgi:hypothetical protein